jgi:hypothetical protein
MTGKQPCKYNLPALRKTITAARRANHLTGPATREQLINLLELHADIDEAYGEALHGNMTVPTLRAGLRDVKLAMHPSVSSLSRTAALQYIYGTAKLLGWSYNELDEMPERARVSKGCVKARKTGVTATAPTRILTKKHRPKRAQTEHQRFVSQEMQRSAMKTQYPDVKDRFRAVAAKWKAEKARRARVPTTRRARADQSIFDAPTETPAPRARVVVRRNVNPSPQATEKPKRKRKGPDPVVMAARKRLKENAYSKLRGGLGAYKRMEDQLTVSNKEKPSKALIQRNLQLQKDMTASRAERAEAEFNMRANERLQQERTRDEIAARTAGRKIPRKQRGSASRR